MVEMNEVNAKGWKVPVLLCQASYDKGIDELYDMIGQHRGYIDSRSKVSRKKRRLRRQELIEILTHRFLKTIEILEQEDGHFRAYLKEAENEKANPYKIAKNIFQDAELGKKIFDFEEK